MNHLSVVRSGAADHKRLCARPRLVRHAPVFSSPTRPGHVPSKLDARSSGASCPTTPCGACLACRKITRGTHPDVQTLDLETQRRLNEKRAGQNTSLTIDSIRQLAADASLRPMEASRRIIIVDDAETMQEVAQEALLKTLEEPPPAVLILLLANEAGRLLPTIRQALLTVPSWPASSGKVDLRP